MPGPEESRTPYPLLAKQMLYQMSYRPAIALKWWAKEELHL